MKNWPASEYEARLPKAHLAGLRWLKACRTGGRWTLGHHEGEGEDDGGHAEGESGVVEEGVEHDAQALSAVDETEAIKCFDEKHGGRAWETDSEGD